MNAHTQKEIKIKNNDIEYDDDVMQENAIRVLWASGCNLSYVSEPEGGRSASSSGLLAD